MNTHNAALTINCNDPDDTAFTINLNGQGQINDLNTTGTKVAIWGIDFNSGTTTCYVHLAGLDGEYVSIEDTEINKYRFTIRERVNGGSWTQIAQSDITLSTVEASAEGKSTVLLVDNTGDMGGSLNALKLAQQQGFVYEKNINDQIAVISISDRVLKTDFTSNESNIISAINNCSIVGMPYLYLPMIEIAYPRIDVIGPSGGLKSIIVFTNDYVQSDQDARGACLAMASERNLVLNMIGFESATEAQMGDIPNQGCNGYFLYTTNQSDFENYYRTLNTYLDKTFQLKYQSTGIASDDIEIEVSVSYISSHGTYEKSDTRTY